MTLQKTCIFQNQVISFINPLLITAIRPRSSARLEYWTLNPGVAGSNPVEAITIMNVAVHETITETVLAGRLEARAQEEPGETSSKQETDGSSLFLGIRPNESVVALFYTRSRENELERWMRETEKQRIHDFPQLKAEELNIEFERRYLREAIPSLYQEPHQEEEHFIHLFPECYEEQIYRIGNQLAETHRSKQRKQKEE